MSAVRLFASVCAHSYAHAHCHSTMVGESGETGNYPRPKLIHILSSALAHGSRVIRE